MKTIAIAMILIISITSLTSCKVNDQSSESDISINSTDKTDSEVTLVAKAEAFTNKLIKEDFSGCVKEFSPELLKALSEEKLKESWKTTIKDFGTFVKIDKTTVEEKNGLDAITVYMEFENNGVTTVLTYDESEKLGGLWFNYYELKRKHQQAPDGIAEIDVLVGEGTQWALPGKITMQGEKPSDTAVVLVHGSGSSDMDETIYQNKPFRDIAWGLTKQGIDVLRYDKRTFVYANKMTLDELNGITVEEETIHDAIAALTMLKDKGYKSVYLVGHSLGGMLTPRIQQESGNKFAGIVALAGSPRTLIDIIIDQNAAVIALLDDENTMAESNKIIDIEKKKLEMINEFSDQQLLTETVFGMPAQYVRDLTNFDNVAAIKQISVPMLILQGKMDFQVNADKDFPLWKESLSDKKEVEYKLYEDLNHLFMKSSGIGTVEEYKTAGIVDQKVIDDIASFINGK